MSKPASSARIPCLDGLRAVAILLVMASHLFKMQSAPSWLQAGNRLYSIVDLGELGVHLFFVISGFIITHLLLREEARYGGVSLKAFWGRRASRILPPLLVFLLVLSLLAKVCADIKPQPVEFIMAMTFTQKLLSPAGTWWLGHTWSLSIEEQFYVLWPLAFLFPKKRRLPALLAWALLIMPAAAWFSMRGMGERAGWIMPAHQGYIVAGCVLALWRFGRQRSLENLPHPWLWILFACVLVLLPRQMLRAPSLNGAVLAYGSVAGGIGIAVIMAMLLDETFERAGAILSSPFLCWIGRLSYTLYLWQQIFIAPHGTEWWQHFPENLLMLGAIVVTCHWWIERPFLRLKDRFFARL